MKFLSNKASYNIIMIVIIALSCWGVYSGIKNWRLQNAPVEVKGIVADYHVITNSRAKTMETVVKFTDGRMMAFKYNESHIIVVGQPVTIIMKGRDRTAIVK